MHVGRAALGLWRMEVGRLKWRWPLLRSLGQRCSAQPGLLEHKGPLVGHPRCQEVDAHASLARWVGP